MDLSIVIAAHNEGDLLWQTVQSCREVCEGLDYEFVVVNDASTDDCVDRLQKHFDDIAVHNTPERLGTSPAKDVAAHLSKGEVLLFLDAHCKPEIGSVQQLLEDVRELQGEAIITPAVAALDPNTWMNNPGEIGHGTGFDFEEVKGRWIPLRAMRPHGRFYESPTLIGCCFAIAKRLYDKLWGFDRDLKTWGAEDADLGVKSWLLGHPVLHDPRVIIGHRFQKAFTTYTAPTEDIVANRLRIAYKALAPERWRKWLDKFRVEHGGSLWYPAWDLFCARRVSAECERLYLWQHRVHDEVWYARQFGLKWPSEEGVLVVGDN